MEAMTSRRIVLLGQTGTGKSALANTMFGEEQFTPCHTAASETRTCQKITKSVDGRNITLIDTPGFFGTEGSEDDMKDVVISCMTQCAPGPHVFLILLKVERFTKQEEELVRNICKHFSEEALKYSLVVFTHGDQLAEGQKIGDFIRPNEALRNLVMKCGGRCHVVDNKYWKSSEEGNYRSNRFQVAEILKTIDQIFEANNGGCFTNEMLRKVHTDIQNEERMLERTSVNLSRGEIRNRAEEKVSNRMKIRLAGVGAAMTSRRIVLLGQTGTGKSALANTMFGEERFTPCHTAASETRTCQKITKSVDGRNITLIDTPGFFGTEGSEDDMKDVVISCMTQCAPGPHVFLILLKVERFTKQEEELVRNICQHFSEEALKYSLVVFTHGDQLAEGQKIGDFIRPNEALRNLVMKCGGRCHVVDNKYWKSSEEGNYRSNRFQVAEILKTIEQIFEANNGGCFTNEMLKNVHTQIQNEERMLERTSVNLSRGEIRKRAEVKVSDRMLIRLAGVGAGMLVGAFLGVVGEIKGARNLKDLSDLTSSTTGLQQMGMAAALGMVRGAQSGFQAAEEAETPGEAMLKAMDSTWKQ